MIKLSVSLPGEPTLAVGLQRFAQTLGDFRPFFNDYFVPAWYELMARQYATEGAATGEAWAPLTARYAAWKQKHFPGQPIGVLTGATRASLTSPADPNAILTVAKDRFEVGTSLRWPIFLQMGTRGRGRSSGRRKLRGYDYGGGAGMPARPPLRVDDTFMIGVGKLLQQFARDAQGRLPMTG